MGDLVVDAARLRRIGWSPPEATVRSACGGRPRRSELKTAKIQHDIETHAIDRRGGLSYVSAMAVLPIITIPDPVLRKISDPVERVDDAVVKLMDDMLETMYAAPGVGLAAPQVGVLKRVVVIDAAEDDAPPNPIAMANPELVAIGSETRLHEEGCLSIPDVRVEIERPSTVTVRYIDRHGKEQELAADGLLATAIQHEIDHLDGQLIIDFLSRLKRDIIIRKFKKQARTELDWRALELALATPLGEPAASAGLVRRLRQYKRSVCRSISFSWGRLIFPCPCSTRSWRRDIVLSRFTASRRVPPDAAWRKSNRPFIAAPKRWGLKFGRR